MNAQAWIALGMLAIAVGGLLFNAGAQWQRLQTHSEDIKALKAKTESFAEEASGIATLRALLESMRQQLEELRKDVKGLLAGRRGQGQ